MSAFFACRSRRWAALLSSATLTACTANHVGSICDTQKLDAGCKDLMMWLQQHGADVHGLDIRLSQSGGMGVFATEDLHAKIGSGTVWRLLSRLGLSAGGMTLASFPSHMMINQPAVVRDTRMGSILEKYLSSGELDSVGALQLWLLAHRELGSESEYAPYFASLSKPDVPTAYPDSTLRELAGTELHAAVQELREKLGRTWGNAQPILREVALACTMDLERLTLEDWMWAFSILTSRSFNIPADSKSPGSTVMSLVPGLDYVNHSRGSAIRWAIDGSFASLDGCITLKCPLHALPRCNDEIRINYSPDASNFALLLQYGFVDEVNSNDVVHITYPCDAPESWSDQMKTRVSILKARNLPLQFALPKGEENGDEPLPLSGHDMIGVFVMDAHAVQSAATDPLQKLPLSLGDELAIYTTFCWLLEQRQQLLEGPHGTGSLDRDIEIIQHGPEGLSHSYWSCVVYRAGQKSIVRKYLKAARRKVQCVIDDLHASK